MASLHFQFWIGRSTISGIIQECLEALQSILKKFLVCPSTKEEWENVANTFLERWQIPNTLGAIDGKHIEINHVRAAGSMYYNYKNTHSIVLMALVDANRKFIYIDVGTNGRASDGGIFGECSLVRAIEHQDNPLGIPPSRPLPGRTTDTPFVILGDDAFPLKSYVMKPYKKKTQEHKEKIYTYRQSRGLLVVENAFGIMTTRFRILLKRIDLKPSKV